MSNEICLADRMSRLGTETAFEVLVRARNLEAQGRSIIHLEIGEPDFDTPAYIVEAAVKALRDGFTHYTPAPGLPEARAAFAEFVSSTRGTQYYPDEIVITPGAKPILFYSMLALVNEGEEVIYPNPGFPIYESVIKFIGAKPVPLPLRREHGFTLDVDELESLITPKTRMLIINSPGNPTGGVIPRKDIERIAHLAQRRGFWVMSDELYSRTIYQGEVFSIASVDGMKDRAIVVEGHSKTYAMTGWRLGYGAMPRELAPWISRLATNCNSCTAAFTQIAGIAAYKGDQKIADDFVKEFRQRRDIIVSGLNQIPGVECLEPHGAFYVFPYIGSLGRTSKELEHYLLNEAGVAALTGTSFGALGEGYIRFSYANSQENIKEALRRVREGLAALKQ